MNNRDLAVAMLVSYAIMVSGGLVGSSVVRSLGGWVVLVFYLFAVYRLYYSKNVIK